MADLRVETPETSGEFVALMIEAGVRLPLALHDEDVGVVIDADKRDVFVVDVESQRDDEQVIAIASWIVLAVNTCGGLRAVQP